ncbi:hypothetical protein [Aequorivita sinensis]|uniref:hypothetical protein n=1 Tax=Aequorivita sinensis TaxID=1382458 RepID=UPI00130DC0D2|nr:hypothetical protein [Aequorivita sinensis]
MTRILFFLATLFLSVSVNSQNKTLSDYSYVIVPEQFDFLNGKDLYKLNSMTEFYLEKNGFNAYMANLAPNANRCDGLFADVEKLKSIIGIKLQVVLRDCNGEEVFRTHEGRTKFKQYDKAYQDALRKAFNSFNSLRVKQKDVVLLSEKSAVNREVVTINKIQAEEVVSSTVKENTNTTKEIYIPDAKFSNYTYLGKTFLLRKTDKGFSLYEESNKASDGLLLRGTLVINNNHLEYTDTSGVTGKAAFDASGDLKINDGAYLKVYKLQN